MLKVAVIGALLVATSGCVSFRTTALRRFANDAVAPQKLNRKLKGLPVKMKVPSHVHVTVYEQQVILADSDDVSSSKKDTAAKAEQAVADMKKQIVDLDKNVEDALVKIRRLKQQEGIIQKLHDAASDNSPQRKGYAESLAETASLLSEARASHKTHEENRKKKNEFELQLKDLEKTAATAANNAVTQYRLISFDPAQYVVETELQYTDKVFLVDFKRPAGGILDLKEASMDDEQYFAKIQADVEERTLADISTALNRVSGPLADVLGGERTNVAVPTSSETPDGETNATVDFQKSVVATQRFDINELGWEQRLQGFVNSHISVIEGQHSTYMGVTHQEESYRVPISQALAVEPTESHSTYDSWESIEEEIGILNQ